MVCCPGLLCGMQCWIRWCLCQPLLVAVGMQWHQVAAPQVPLRVQCQQQLQLLCWLEYNHWLALALVCMLLRPSLPMQALCS